MDSLYLKILVVALIFIGEALSIYAELLGAKTHFVQSQPALSIFLKMFLMIALAGGFLITGYMFGFSAFKNIWIISAVSITSILIVEPVLNLVIFKQFPTTGAAVGLILGILGFLAAMIL